MDEIICPECGRPNLIEAEKCWYCQVTLVNNDGKENHPEDPPDPGAEFSDVENPKIKSSGDNEGEENLPEWLKRIRDLKKADTPVEEVDQWQQEKLFSGLAQEKDNSAKHTDGISQPLKPLGMPAPKPVITEDQPLLEEAPAEENLKEEIGPEEIETNDSDDELPEGFTPLEL